MRRFDPATRERGRPARMHPRYVPLSSLRYGTRQASARPSSSKSDGTWAHLGARASRPHPPPLRAPQFPCDTAPGHPAGRNGMGSVEAESWLRCRSIRVEEMAEAVSGFVRAGNSGLPGGTSFRDVVATKAVHQTICLFMVRLQHHRQFLPPMICPAAQVRNLFETAIP